MVLVRRSSPSSKFVATAREAKRAWLSSKNGRIAGELRDPTELAPWSLIRGRFPQPNAPTQS